MLLLLKRILAAALICISLFSYASQVNATGYTWHVVGSDHFAGISVSHTPIAISSNGVIYVAYADAVNDNKANVMKYDGTDWSQVGTANFSAGGASDLSLAVDAAGTPYLAYVDAASSSRANVVKYTNSDWVTVGNADFSTSSIRETSLALDPNGVPYVVFINVENASAPTIMKLDGSTWEIVGDAYPTQGGAPSIVFTASGTPYVAFSDIGSGSPTIISFNGSSWSQVGTPPPINLNGNCPIALNPSGIPYIAVADVGTPDNIQTYRFDSGNWTQVGADFIGPNSGNLAIAINSDGTPYVSWLTGDTSKGNVIAYDGSSWSQVGSAQFTSPAQNPVLPIAIGPNGGPYVVYSDRTDSNYQLTVKAYLPTVPGQVTGLTASSVSSESISLTWNSIADTGGADIVGYRIDREAPGGNSYSTIVTDTGSIASTYTNFDLRSASTYRYRVTAINSIGAGTASAATTATTLQGTGSTPFFPIAPTTMSDSQTDFAFTINNGAQTTSNTSVMLGFNANPQTVRGYAASLDPSFKNASIFPLDQKNVILPNVPGSYTLYLKYYSPMGISSPVLSQTITYQAGPETTVTPLPLPIEFKRTLKPGDTGPDVKRLQQFLNSHGYIVSKAGAGSLNHETDYFGPSTATAVTRFQEAHTNNILVPNGLIKGTGVFGNATRKELIKILEHEA